MPPPTPAPAALFKVFNNTLGFQTYPATIFPGATLHILLHRLHIRVATRMIPYDRPRWLASNHSSCKPF
ncbi:hypothetical protein DL95DRAFT_392200 [Leptodontidium sp. 2 PMI_412]|nr:hypothetical protein DL95DRAFT_392200 [Leptodontidium sp. 2 PMI_412]